MESSEAERATRAREGQANCNALLHGFERTRMTAAKSGTFNLFSAQPHLPEHLRQRKSGN